MSICFSHLGSVSNPLVGNAISAKKIIAKRASVDNVLNIPHLTSWVKKPA